ncbi:MAG TPA: helix-turn-helix domain-containing protein [Rhizomicrobium sp.]
MTDIDTRQAILNAARAMVQARGYNALSFRDLAKAVGVKSASVHYHFPTKGDLGAVLARHYTEELAAYLDGLPLSSQSFDATLKRYAEIFRAPLLNGNRMCLGGILAAEREDLPAAVTAEVEGFAETNIRWLVKLLSRRKSKAGKDALRRQALAIFAALEGAQLIARSRGDVSAYDDAVAAYKAAGLFA